MPFWRSDLDTSAREAAAVAVGFREQSQQAVRVRDRLPFEHEAAGVDHEVGRARRDGVAVLARRRVGSGPPAAGQIEDDAAATDRVALATGSLDVREVSVAETLRRPLAAVVGEYGGVAAVDGDVVLGSLSSP